MLIVTSRKTAKKEVKTIEIGRSTNLGNPFHLRNESERHRVCQAHRAWVWKVLNGEETAQAAKEIAAKYKVAIASTWKKPSTQQYLQDFENLADMATKETLQLQCFCKQEGREVECHGDVLAKAIEWYNAQK
jgi:aminoglycoside phosphotransferase family enzyme